MITLKRKTDGVDRQESDVAAMPPPRGPSLAELDWWSDGLSDVDKVNILKSPLEDRARLLASNHSKSIDETILEMGERLGIPVLEDFKIPENATRLLPLRIIHEYCCLPMEGSEEGKISIVTVWPPTDRMSRWVFAVSGKKPVWSLGSPENVVRAITENFGIGADSLEESDIDLDDENEAADDLEDQNAAIIRFVNEVIQRAIVDRATDIHFEPHKETLQIRYRIDGQLVPIRVPDNLRSFQDAIISRIKIMSGINISEKRRPQGGRITFTQGQSDLDIRVSTLPTLYGESVSLRLLNEKSQPLSMRELGLLPKDERIITAILEKPHGIVLVTGPTGSGKSTSLTAYIRKIHRPETRIMTVEDPVEYEVAGVNQTQVNAEIGFTFASVLREILRQDPDVIMVGEIRDSETADIAIRASLTGHLVLSTLHTNDAPGAITRLIDMEIEPFLIASSIEMVIAQRLVRRLCNVCSSRADLDEGQFRANLTLLGVSHEELASGENVMRSVGCQQCQNLGYRGRVGIFEIMPMSDAIHSLVIKNATAPDIRRVAINEGMRSLQLSGWEQIKRGLTTFDEVLRYSDSFGEDNSNGHDEETSSIPHSL
jgi:general secretion pathway protein E